MNCAKLLVAVSAVMFGLAPPAGAARMCAPVEIRAMTYNIRLDTPADGQDSWSHRRGWVSAQIDWFRPDIFGLQEVVINQKRDLAADLPDYQLVGNGRDDGADAGESSPIGFDRRRFDLREAGTFWLSPTPTIASKGWDAAYSRVVTWARLRMKGRGATVLAINTHWDHIGVEARKQSGLQMQAWLSANRRKGDNVVLLGDFNSDIDSDGMQAMLNPASSTARLRDSRTATHSPPFGPAGTFNGFRVRPENPPTIDHILVSDSLTVRRFAVIAQTVDDRLPSDHYPVLADLTLGSDCPPALQTGRQIAFPATPGGYPYLRFLPRDYGQARNRRWPLLIFLHGSGERGNDVEQVKVHGPPKLLEGRPDFPFVTISPQLEADADWDIARLADMLAQIRKDVRIDSNRIYLTGLSLGGHGTWRWAAAQPDLFAAIAPISGRGNPAGACALKSLPVWAFHGDKDSVVELTGSTNMVAAINACGGTARMTLYPETGHDAWTRTYADPALFKWLLAQHR